MRDVSVYLFFESIRKAFHEQLVLFIIIYVFCFIQKSICGAHKKGLLCSVNLKSLPLVRTKMFRRSSFGIRSLCVCMCVCVMLRWLAVYFYLRQPPSIQQTIIPCMAAISNYKSVGFHLRNRIICKELNYLYLTEFTRHVQQMVVILSVWEY